MRKRRAHKCLSHARSATIQFQGDVADVWSTCISFYCIFSSKLQLVYRNSYPRLNSKRCECGKVQKTHRIRARVFLGYVRSECTFRGRYNDPTTYREKYVIFDDLRWFGWRSKHVAGTSLTSRQTMTYVQSFQIVIHTADFRTHFPVLL